jgi:hypothetical protein
MQTINYFIVAMGMSDLILADEKFACIVASLIHDLDHQGYNNAFLISTGDPLAIRYNDKSVRFFFVFLLTQNKRKTPAHFIRGGNADGGAKKKIMNE